MSCVIGVDIGTTSTKAVLFDLDGQVISSHSVSYPLYQPYPSWAEQDPEEIFNAFIQSLNTAILKAGVSSADVIGIGFSTAMHSLIVMDQDDRPITRVITWADGRSVDQAERLKQSPDGNIFYRRTGTPIHPMSPLTKIMWLKEQKPELYQRAAKFISIKEYVLHRLFGEYVVDHSIASATGMFHLKQQEWDEEIVRFLGIRNDQLSRLVPTTTVLKGMDKSLAAEMNLQPETPFVIGASDGVLANVGVGATQPGEVALTIGTSGAVRTCTDRPVTDERGRTFCYALTEQKWVIGGATNNGGILMNWFRDEFAKEDWEKAKQQGGNPFNIILKDVKKVPAGAEGLLCLPFFTGERAPYWDADMRGSFFGVHLQHRKEHFLRAILEGICFSLHSVTSVLEELAGSIHEVRASGGFVRSSLWLQILSDVLGKRVLVPQSPEASALGAAALALLSLGEISDLEEVKKWMCVLSELQPALSNHKVYQSLFAIYDRLAHKMKDEFHQMADFQRSNK
jgi:gluconokinase